MDSERVIEDASQGPSSRLIKGINMNELLQTKEACFEVQPQFEAEDYEDGRSRYFDKRMVECEFLNDGVALGFEDDSGSESEGNEDLSPFERLERKMTDITDGQKLIMKMVLKEGSGEVVPAHSTVRVHYSIYIEYHDTPFDSTYLRDEPVQFRLGVEPKEVITGLDLSVASMRYKEISYFLVKPKYAFGEMGVPPRIPKNAVLLYKVELVEIIDDIAAARYRKMDISERETLTFEQVCKACRSERESGNKYFDNKMIKKALHCYQRAKKMLENFHLKDEVEEQAQQQLLLKCYLNLSMCHLKLNNAPPVISNCNLALEIQRNNVKALFRKGKAFLMLQDFDKALKFLKMAQRIEPNNHEIIAELKLVAKRRGEMQDLERAMCKKMFIASPPVKEKPKEMPANVSKEFEEYLAKHLSEIKHSESDVQLKLPANLTSVEYNFAVYVAKKLELKVTTSKVDGIAVTKISK